jgi:hypothetical protein
MAAPGSQGGAYIGNNILVDVSGAPWSGFPIPSTGLQGLTVVRQAPGQFGGWLGLMNLATVPTYISLYDAVDIATVSLGNTPLLGYFPLSQSNGTAANGTSANWEMICGLSFTKGLVVAAVTAVNGATAVAANLLYGTLLHRGPPVTR